MKLAAVWANILLFITTAWSARTSRVTDRRSAVSVSASLARQLPVWADITKTGTSSPLVAVAVQFALRWRLLRRLRSVQYQTSSRWVRQRWRKQPDATRRRRRWRHFTTDDGDLTRLRRNRTADPRVDRFWLHLCRKQLIIGDDRRVSAGSAIVGCTYRLTGASPRRWRVSARSGREVQGCCLCRRRWTN